MSRFKMEFELQGLKVKIEGSREDASLITQNLGGQIAGVLQPMAQIIDGSTSTSENEPDTSTAEASSKKPRRRRQASNTHTTSKDVGTPIDLAVHPEKFGVPRQTWKTADKALWLIYVLQDSNKGDQHTTRTIVDTFNKHFKQSGRITTSNVTRDLGRLKTNERPPPVGEDNSKEPSTWYLTDEGRKRAQKLVGSALGDSE